MAINLVGLKSSNQRMIRCISDKIWGQFEKLIERSRDHSNLELKINLPKEFVTFSFDVMKEFEKTAYLLTKSKVTIQYLGLTKKKKCAKFKFFVS